MSKQLLTKPSLQNDAILYRILMIAFLLASFILLSSFDGVSEKSVHNADIVFNGQINNESKILRRVSDLPLLLDEWMESNKYKNNIEQQELIQQIQSSEYLSNNLRPVMILDPHPRSSAPSLSKVYLAVFQLPEDRFVRHRPSFDKLPEVINSWSCDFSGSIKSKKEIHEFEINQKTINNFIAIPYGPQYEADLYWLLSNHELVYDQY